MHSMRQGLLSLALGFLVTPVLGAAPVLRETSVPEPETFVLIGLGLVLIGMVGARRHRH